MLLMGCLLMVALMGCGGGHGQLEKAVRSVLVSGDTTRVAYDSLCTLITENPGKYGDMLTPEGRVDHKKLAEFIEEIGSHLRPPMHWDTRPYGGVDDLSLTIYFERSGSMVPYDQRGGGGQLKKAVNDLINHFPAGSKVFGLTAGLPVNLQGFLVGAHPDSTIWGLESFGFSAPYKVLDQKFGFTAENVYEQALKVLSKNEK